MSQTMTAPAGTTKRSGIYMIVCQPTQRAYIGSAVNIGGRIRGHAHGLRSNKHHNRFLQRAWNKYGASAFSISVIEFCEPKNLLLREQIHIDRLKSSRPRGFNINPLAVSSYGLKRGAAQIAKMRAANLGKRLSEETKAKISATLKVIAKDRRLPRWVIEKAASFNRGRPLSTETRAKMSAVRKGIKRPVGLMQRLAEHNRGKKRSPETIAKMKLYHQRKAETIKLLSL